MEKRSQKSVLLSVLACVLIAGSGALSLAEDQAAKAAGAAAAKPAESNVRPVHDDPEAATEGLMQTVRAFMYRDPEHLSRSLELLSTNVRALKSEEREIYGGIVSFSNSFEMTGLNAIEFANQGDLKNAYDQFHWMQRACVSCHVAAEEKGLMPPAGLKSN